MVKVRPFQGYLANKKNAAKVISPAYDVLDTAEALAMSKGNPMSFLHVNKPEIDLPKGTDPYSDSVYQKGRENLLKFIEKGYLEEDSEETMYIYRQVMGSHTQQGIVALANINDYETNKIKRHEYTLPKKEQDRTKLTDIQCANVGPVFLTFSEMQEEIKAKMNEVINNNAPYGDVTCDDGNAIVRHVLWRCPVAASNWFQKAFSKISALYVADGHHRTAAAYNVGKNKRDKALAAGLKVTGEEPFNYFMTLLYPADNLYVLDYNRVLKSLGNNTVDQFMAGLKKNFTIKPLPKGADTTVKARHQFSLLLEKKWYTMTLKPSKLNTSSPITQLDSQILTDLIFTPLVGITDIKKDPRIDFVGGIRGHKELVKRCNEDCVVALAMYPTSMEELISVADAGLIMPPKSTWFEPKPRSGFVVRCWESGKTAKPSAAATPLKPKAQRKLSAKDQESTTSKESNEKRASSKKTIASKRNEKAARKAFPASKVMTAGGKRKKSM